MDEDRKMYLQVEILMTTLLCTLSLLAFERKLETEGRRSLSEFLYNVLFITDATTRATVPHPEKVLWCMFITV